MRWLFVVDPLGTLALAGDTSLAIAEAALDAGLEIWACTLTDLAQDLDRGVVATARPFTACRPLDGVLDVGPPEELRLADVDLVLMRKDPPFDIEYVYATYLLEAAEAEGVRVVNGPRGLRDCNEKVYPLRYPDLCPPSLLSRDGARIRAFLARCGGRGVIKPLDMMGGKGVLLLDEGDPNLDALVAMSTEMGRKRVLVQAFVDEAVEGDTRVLLVDGEVLGAFVRRPKAGDFRGNLSAGASAHAADLGARDREILARVVPDLLDRGQRFVGLDIIGAYVTEVNVTSPMGLRELDRLHGGRSAEAVVAAFAGR